MIADTPNNVPTEEEVEAFAVLLDLDKRVLFRVDPDGPLVLTISPSAATTIARQLRSLRAALTREQEVNADLMDRLDEEESGRLRAEEELRRG